MCEEQVLKLFAQVREIEKTFEGQRQTPGIVFVGTVHARILEILEKHLLVKSKTEEHFKFIFKIDNLPAGKPTPRRIIVVDSQTIRSPTCALQNHHSILSVSRSLFRALTTG